MVVAGNIYIISTDRKEHPYYYMCKLLKWEFNSLVKLYDTALQVVLTNENMFFSHCSFKQTFFVRDTVEFVQTVLLSLTLVTDFLI